MVLVFEEKEKAVKLLVNPKKQVERAMQVRVFHENMFFRKKISATHYALAWGLV